MNTYDYGDEWYKEERKTLKVMLYQSGFTRLCCGNKQSLSLHSWPISHSYYMCQMQVGRGLWSLRDPSWWRHPLSICTFLAWLLWKEDLEKLDTCFQQEVTHVNTHVTSARISMAKGSHVATPNLKWMEKNDPTLSLEGGETLSQRTLLVSPSVRDRE